MFGNSLIQRLDFFNISYKIQKIISYKFLAINGGCSSATHQDMTGSGARDVKLTTYSGSTELEKDISCCSKCKMRNDCEYWVRATDTNKCWLKSNDKNEILEVPSSLRRGGLSTTGIIWNFYFYEVDT